MAVIFELDDGGQIADQKGCHRHSSPHQVGERDGKGVDLLTA